MLYSHPLFQVAGAFMAPISQLHGLGVEEFSQTGPVDHITAIVNRTKTNVVSNSIVRSFL